MIENFSPGDEDMAAASGSLKAMAHPLRLKILCLLSEKEQMRVQEIVATTGSSQSNISQHLAMLRRKNILAASKHANRVFYRIEDRRVLHLIKTIRTVFRPSSGCHNK